jgi:hypothetical protein
VGTKYYVLRIKTKMAKTNEAVSSILKIQPTKVTNHLWEYELIENDDDEYVDFVPTFLDILCSSNIKRLEKLSIKKKDISIWLLYEYDSQCNIEISSKDLAALGEADLPLQISCWLK